jgi:hypothetical protein
MISHKKLWMMSKRPRGLRCEVIQGPRMIQLLEIMEE